MNQVSLMICIRTRWIGIFAILLYVPWLVQAASLFPELKTVSDFSPINSSSTCGTPAIKVCRSSREASSLDVCTEDTCKFACCDSCSSSKPTPSNIGKTKPLTSVGITNGASKPGSSDLSFTFVSSSDSHIEPLVLPAIDYTNKGFTLSVWIKQKAGNKGTLVSKSLTGSPYKVIFQLEIENYKIWFHHQYSSGNTSVVELAPLQSQSQNLKPNEWHLITVTVINTDLSYFIDKQLINAEVLKGAVNDPGGRVRIGQKYGGGSQYEGLMQDVFLYSISLTNREVVEAFSGILSKAYVATQCRCPPGYPKIMEKSRAKCTKNGGLAAGQSKSRLAVTAHPIELATDGDSTTYWQSELTNTATIYLDLKYGVMQILYIILEFYGPQPSAIKIDRSHDHGLTFKPWQYFAENCVKSFNMINNGRLSQPDSVNCIQYDLRFKSSGAYVSFKTEQPPPDGSSIPVRPFGSPCTNLYCSVKLLEFLKASHVKFSFFNHTLVKNDKHKYFALHRIVVAGRCECFGHTKKATYIQGNATHHGKCVCLCDASTFTDGEKCDRCLPLYNNKPFRRGTNTNSYPCVKCQCNQHASSCYYNKTLDASPNSRTQAGGGACVDCQHNTAGRYCHTCKGNYYRESGKNLTAVDVCTQCACTGPGVQLNRLDCVKDDTTPGVLAGQCQCKQFTKGRQCSQCKPGYFDLKSSHLTGCVTCGCKTAGTVSGKTSCHATTGHCDCKSNVTGAKCDTCRSGFYGLSAVEPTGCKACGCDPFGSQNDVCDGNSGQCQCKQGSTGRRCVQCDDGFHSPSASGCKKCNCSQPGTKPSLINKCNKANGQCYCKTYTEGTRCSRCQTGYFNISSSNPDGCVICTCDPKGTVGMSRQCEVQSGNCTCKRYVVGKNCNQCQTGTYNMSLSNPEGCQKCNCFPKGTQDPLSGAVLGCSSNGQCACLSNVEGKRCDTCQQEYYWNPSGKGCVPCNCNAKGSVSTSCNTTGQCPCKPNIGGLRCDRCLPGNYGFNTGNCQPCGCNLAGSVNNGCDDSGKCTSCKKNVEGDKCDKCKTGTINLQSNNSYGCSGVPSQQAPPFVKVISSRILGISWNQPDNPNGIIDRYELYRNGTLVYKGLNRAFNDTGLAPNSYYYYYILTYTEAGHTRSFQDNRVYKTPEDSPEQIAPPTITEVKARTAKAVWTKPLVTNGLIVQYRLVSVNSRNSSEVEHCRALILGCDVSNLKPFTTYDFTVISCNSGGCGRSPARNVTTREAAPDFQPMPNIILISGGESVVVTWDEPPVPNGKVFRYDLYMRTTPFSGAGNVITPSSPVDVRNITVSSLVPFTFYEFRVVAFTAEVDGDKSSDWKRVRTAEGVPTGESAIQPQSAAVSSDSIKITWSEPSQPKGIIVRYIIKVFDPPRELIANGTDHSLVAKELKPYTSYKFTVRACNSYRCTGESASTSERTLSAAPKGQGSPRVTNVDSNSVFLEWNHPATLNGPLPPSYNITRAPASFNDPPQQVTAGVHFPGLGYYKFPADFITSDARNDIEFSFRTQHPNGLIVFLASDGSQNDLLAVELREGNPWLVYDCQTGPAAFTVNVTANTRFDDNKWHHMKITRLNRDGTMTIDGRYTGSGSSASGSSTISGHTAVYVGGLPNDFKIKRSDSGNAVLKRLYFIGCLKNFKSNDKEFDWKKAVTKEGVEPETNACPIRMEGAGALLRGGGFIAIKPDVFLGSTFFPFEMTFRTQLKSGLLVFAYGRASHVGLLLKNGKINVKVEGTNNKTSYEFPSSQLCDGSWNMVQILSFGVNGFVISVNSQNHVIQGITGIAITSELYIGGIPLENDAVAEKARNAGIDPDKSFSGCIKNLLTTSKIVLSRDVIRIRNVDLDGCASNKTVSTTLQRGTCLGLDTVDLSTQNKIQYTDSSVRPFVDYLYRVSSFHQGTPGSSKSPWISTRSGPGAPTGISAPTSVTPLQDGRSVKVVWSRPERPNGLIVYYNIIALSSAKPSDKVVTKVNDVDTLKATVTGLTPYTLYGIQIAAFTWGGNGTGPSVNVTTLQAAPEDVSTPTATRLPRALLLSWTPPASPNGIITGYNLTVDNKLVYSGVGQYFNVTGLDVYQLYTVQLTACTVIGCTIGPKVSILTGELPPEGLSLPTLEVKSNDSMRVQWDIPTRPNGVITKYEIHISTSEPLGPGYRMVYNGTRSDLSALITGLVTGTLYYVRVKAFSGGGGTYSNASSARTLSGIPSDIPAPILTALSPYSIHVRILLPRKPNGMITRYELYQDSIVSPLLNTTVLTNYTAHGFKVYTQHSFYARVCTKIGCNPGEIARTYTGELPPNGTVHLTATIVAARKVRVKWTSVAQPNGNLSYHLVIKGRFLVPGSAVMATEIRNERALGKPETEWTYDGLLPHNNYEFWVNASNSEGYILSNKESGKTPETAPDGIIPPKATVLSSTSINVTWQPPYLHNGVLVGYALYQQTNDNETTVYSGNDLSFLVTGLEPYTRYRYRVSASTAKGTGYGNLSEFWTLEDIPADLDAPQLNSDSRSMLLQWDHPSKPNGIIIQYSIYMNGSLLVNVTGNTTKYRVSNLKPFTLYTFAVTACTAVGCKQSLYSPALRTLESVPSGLSKPIVQPLSPRSVEIRWDAPNITNGIITSYSIYRRRVGQQAPVKIASVNASEPRMYIDRTVQPFTFYEYRVVAYTVAGGGTPSDYSNVTTGEGDPENINAPQVTALSSSSLLVNWTAPGTPNGHLINYIVRVLETGANFTMNSSVFQYTITGLKPFIMYSIVIRACTIGDCGESPPTKKRTLAEVPSGQPAPTAKVLSSTSLLVTWNPPSDPNSAIERYKLYRRTIEEPVNENFTQSVTFVKVYSGDGRTYMYEDKGLGIYSLQRYKVTVFTTTGSSTSPTADYRTGPAPPLDGPLLNATAVNHTTVILSWSPPRVSRLRGSVESYTVYYEHIISSVNTVVHRLGSVPGNTTTLAVKALKPSTKYRFWVTLYNGAGNATSDPVSTRTLDGVPEGFGVPVLFDKSSTEIRVSWTSPTTPNGEIVIYKIYGNGKLLANASANSRQVMLTNLLPYTEYNIKVEVCTMYACTKSPVASQKTQPAAPEGLAPPRLTPAPNFMTINWDPPSRPNGIMAGYKLFRRKIHACPTSPPPVSKCTYIECNISQSLCGSTCYDPVNKICCNGVLHQRDRANPNKQCCGTAYTPKNNVDDVCCGNKFNIKQNEFQCCQDNYMRVPAGSVCCRRNDGGAVVGFGDSCCGDRPYFINGSKVCVCDGLFERSPSRQCCGGKVVASAQICCGTTKVGIAYDVDATQTCCGTQYVAERITLCCKGSLGIVKVYNYSSSAEKNSKAEKCCNTNKVAFGMSCCNTIGYNSSYQTCADRSSQAEKDCGTGLVCNTTNSVSARCNRCDFPSNKRVCGFVNGFYRPTSVPVTPKICASEFQEIFSRLNDPHTLTYTDVSLTPHTEYEYYLVGNNTVGSTNSSIARNKTQMANPDGLDPPVATTISASSIHVTWKPPRVSNGILKEYKLTRINKQTNQRRLVYSGLELTFTDDNGLEPFTGYVYELQACTTECTSVLSTTIAYTDEAAPSIVSPPRLTALSSTRINVSWSLPPKPNGRIIRYNISQIINSTHKIRLNPNDKGLNMFLIVTNLKPYQNYTFKVAACTKIGCKEGPTASVFTLEAAPQGIRPPVLVARGALEIEASWFEPDVPNGIIYLYLLYRNDTLVYNGTDVCSKTVQGQVKCIYKDTGLRPMTLYSYEVAATTKGGTTRSGRSSAHTPESSPEGVPLPRLTPRSAYEIYAEWDPPQTPNGVITRYAIIVDGKKYDVGLNKNKVIRGLKPYTKYEFQVKACTSKGCGIGNRAYARTSEAAPSGISAPRVEAKEWNIVYVSWDQPTLPNGVITEYKVERRLPATNPPIIVCLTTDSSDPTRNCLDSSNSLKGYTVYEYRILAKTGGGIGTGPWKIVRTLEGPPRGIKQPTVYVINATAVTAKWEVPLEPNGVITHYELRYQPLNVVDGNISVAGRVDSNTFNMTVNILKANTDYQFLITAINRRRQGSSSWTFAKTKEASPSDVKPLNAERLGGGTSLRLFWDQPGSPNGVISTYNIYKDGIKIYEGKTRQYTVTRLTPYTAYEFQLEACTSAGCTKGAKQTIYSAEINPSGQAPPSTEFNNATVAVIAWRPPAVPNGAILRYDVVRTSESLQARRRRSVSEDIVYSTNNTNATRYTYMDTGLKPYTKYKYKIRAVNKGGQTDSDWLIVHTVQAPPSSVSAPTVITLDAYRLNVTWSKPGQANGIIQYYLVHRNGTISHQGNGLYFVDVGREPYTVYSYTVTACSGRGCTVSKPTLKRTNEAAPAQVTPPTLKALSAIAIRITWSMPLKPNGIITAYKLFENTITNPLYSGKDQSFTVSARKPYTEYTFYIEACTRAGCTKSPSSKVRTLEFPPGSMEAPVATVAGSRHVRVEWKPPAQPNGIVLYYILARDGSVVYNGSDVRYDDYNIAPYTIYSYTITAYNKAGRGIESPVGRNPKTYPGAPDNITAPSLTVVSATSMRVKWKEPGRPNGVISKYYVLYNNQEKDASLSKEVVLSGLQPYTVYVVRIKACTTSVACSVGEHAQARTHEAAPESQGYPVIPSASVKARQVLVTWSKPDKPNGFIITYTLQRRQVYRPIGAQLSHGPVTSICNKTNGSLLSFTDRTVKPYSEYEYRVTSANSIGSTTSGWAVAKTLTDVPENIPKPQIIKVHQDKIEVLIKAPLQPNGEIRNYVLKVSGKNTSTGLELSRVVSNLEPYTTYQISTYACNDAGCVASPEAVARTTEGTPTKFSAPRVAELLSRSVELVWDEPVKPNGIVRRYEVLYRVSCAKPLSCELPANGTNVSLKKNANVTGLQPYITYDFIIRVYNDKYSGLSDVKIARTLPEDPVARPDSPPRVNVTGYHVSVDWSQCFILNGPLDGYTLLERGIIVFLGEKISADLPNRERGEYTYEVLVTTIVNGQKKTARSPKVNVVVPNEGVIEPPVTSQPLSDPVYRKIWFIAVMALIGIILVFLILALCLRKRSSDRTVYVREREPLPPRTKMRSRPSSMSSLYSVNGKGGSMIDLNTFNSGSQVALFDNGGRLTPKADRYDSIDRYERYNRYNKSMDLTNGSVHKVGLDESSDWNDHPQTYSNKDSGLYLDDKAAYSDSEEESTPRQYSYKREQYFTDTHL